MLSIWNFIGKNRSYMYMRLPNNAPLIQHLFHRNIAYATMNKPFCMSSYSPFCSNKQHDKHNQMLIHQQQFSDAEEIQKQLALRMKQLEIRHKQIQQYIDTRLKFPVKLCGTKDSYENRFSYLPQRVMSYYRIPKARITDYLLKMFKASLYAIAQKNQRYMDEYWQKSFKQEAISAINKAYSNNYTIRVEQDKKFLQQFTQSCEILDSVMIRGISMDRSQNKNPVQYAQYQEADQIGLITFTPRHLTENNENFINPSKNKNVYQGYQKLLLRTLVRIKSPLRIIIPQLKVPDDIYTWEHICVMENQMVAPKHLQSKYKLETLMQWLGKYRFGPWKIADIDNTMKGNSPFQKYRDSSQKLDPIFKGTKLDKSYYIDIRIM